MFGGLFIISFIGSCIQMVKEACEPTIPVENWANQELYHKDMMNGVPVEQRMKNLRNGKYRLTTTYPEPHRDASGKIIIENCKLYHDDIMKYGGVQVQKWVERGKYNLTPEELKKEEERIKARLEYLCSL